MVKVVCVNAGNYLEHGAEYVNKLYAMVKKNTTIPHEFVCLTDDVEGLNEDIKTILLPEWIKGWYAKLYLFKHGLFTEEKLAFFDMDSLAGKVNEADRIVFFDLDTLIIDNIDELLEYKGEFAALDDFYVPGRFATGVMLFEAGKHSEIWDEWYSTKKTDYALGDMEFINNLNQGRYTNRLPRLQKLFKGKFCSYKEHCRPYPPDGTSVVCFHGLPRPHEVNGWANNVWHGGSYAKERGNWFKIEAI